MIYFDHNASSPMLPEAKQAWVEATELYIGNPSSPHRLGSRAEAALNGARQALARMLGCDPLDIVWTSGATEANNLALHHLRTSAENREIWVSAIEHPSVLEPSKAWFGKELRLIPVSRTGVIDCDWLDEKLRHNSPAAIVVMAANNETGALQPWDQIAGLCAQRGVSFFCDATQWLGKLPATGLGRCDLVSGSAHKFGGPRGVGFLKCPASGSFRASTLGGPQEEGRRAGTENVAGVLSMMRALEIRESQLGSLSAATENKNAFEAKLLSVLPGSEIVARDSGRLWNTTMALMPAADCQQRWVVKLDKLGFAVSTGSACASGKEKPSHVLSAMGYSSGQAARALRFSCGWNTTENEWTALLDALAKLR
jgi:cysteine desulfurase